MSWNSDVSPQDLVGFNLLSAELSNGVITLKTDGYVIEGEPEGDCCSRSWIEHFENDGGGEITKFDSSSDGEIDESLSDKYTDVKQYFSTLYTEKGRVTWEMRNSSNGYYGGWISWRKL